MQRLVERPAGKPKTSALTTARRFGPEAGGPGASGPVAGPDSPSRFKTDFSRIPLHAPRSQAHRPLAPCPPAPLARGSTAHNAEEEGLFIGAPPSETETSSSSETSDPSSSFFAPDSTEGDPVDPRAYSGPTAVTPLITSTTAKKAPSGAKADRSKVGVGEAVTFAGSAPGTWSASIGAPKGFSGAKYRWKAPPVTSATSVTVTLKVSGLPEARKKLTVLPPNKISMKNSGSHTSQVGPGGACMLTEVTFAPLEVNLGAMRWLEEPGPATSVSGYFSQFTAATLAHKPNTHFALVNDKNVMEAGPKNAPNDHIAAHTLPGPYKTGAFEWVIDNQYILDGEAKAKGRRFAKTTQRYAMDGAGNLTITKAGATT